MPLESKKYVMKSLTDAEIIKGSSGQVYTSKDYNLVGVNNLANRRDFIRNRFEIGGLYDIRIFGLVDYCKCMSTRVFKGQQSKKCPVCGITVFGSEEDQSKAYGHFVMPYAVTTPIKVSRLRQLIKDHGWSISNGLGTLSEYETLKTICMSGYNATDGRYELTDDTPQDEIGLDGLYKMGGFETCVNRVLVIPSTCYRTCYPKRNKRTGSIELNMAGDTRMGTQLSAILSFTQFMKERMPSNLSVVELATIKFNYVWLVYNYFRQSPILSGGKFHSVRDLTRSTIESSIRATIAPCLDLELNKVRVPAGLAYHALDEAIKDRLIEQGYTAANAIREIKDHTELAQKTFEEILNNETICLLWRNPVLYKNSVAVVYPELWHDQDEAAIGFPIELCSPLNADFDGDQVAISFITDPDQYKFLSENCSSDKILTYEKTLEPVYTPTQGILMGLYIASSTKHSKDNGKTFTDYPNALKAYENKEIEFDELIRVGERVDSFGRFRLSDIIGKDISLIIPNQGCITKKNIGKVVSVIYSQPDYVKRLQRLKEWGIECTTLNGLDVPFSAIYDMNDPKLKEIAESSEDDDIKLDKFNEYTKEQLKKTIMELPDTNFGDMVASGSRLKDEVLRDMYAPTLKIDKDGKARIEVESQFRGLTESTFVARSLDNRIVQEIKKDATPLSGYITRQMVVANSAENLMYDAEHLSPDKIGLEMTADDALGRYDMQGNIIEQGGSNIVRVKSCLNHTQKKVFKDEVAYNYPVKNGSNISINVATAFSEFMTQGILGLKYGRSGSKFNETHVYCEAPGVVVELNEHFLVVNLDRGGTNTYYVNPSARVRVRIGDRVSKGQEIITGIKPNLIGNDLGQLCSLLDIQPTIDYAVLKSNNPKLLVYTPITGYSEFYERKGKPIMIITDGKDKVEFELGDETLFYPEGHKYTKGERVMTGVLDLGLYAKYVPRLEVFAKFKQQCKDIFPKVNVRSEIYEVLFKSIEKTLSVSKAIKSNTGDIDLMQRIYYGSTKSGLSSYFKNRDEVELQDSLILSLLFNDVD